MVAKSWLLINDGKLMFNHVRILEAIMPPFYYLFVTFSLMDDMGVDLNLCPT